MVGDRGGAGGVWVVENALGNPGCLPESVSGSCSEPQSCSWSPPLPGAGPELWRDCSRGNPTLAPLKVDLRLCMPGSHQVNLDAFMKPPQELSPLLAWL